MLYHFWDKQSISPSPSFRVAVVQEIGGLSIGKSAVRFLTILHVEVLGKLLKPELPSMQPLKL